MSFKYFVDTCINRICIINMCILTYSDAKNNRNKKKYFQQTQKTKAKHLITKKDSKLTWKSFTKNLLIRNKHAAEILLRFLPF